MVTGCTGTPARKPPVWNLISADPLVVVPSEKMNTLGQSNGDLTLVTISSSAVCLLSVLLLSTNIVCAICCMEDITGVLLFSILATGDPPHMEMTNTSRNEVCGAAMITGAFCLDTGVPLIVTRKPSM